MRPVFGARSPDAASGVPSRQYTKAGAGTCIPPFSRVGANVIGVIANNVELDSMVFISPTSIRTGLRIRQLFIPMRKERSVGRPGPRRDS